MGLQREDSIGMGVYREEGCFVKEWLKADNNIFKGFKRENKKQK